MYRILFVDDEALIREGVSENVPWEELGFELAGICQHGKEACEFLFHHHPEGISSYQGPDSQRLR